MSRRMWWIVGLVAAGIALAIIIGVLATRNETSKTEAASSLCTSLQSLESSLQALTSIDPSTATTAELQSDASAVTSAWDQVKSDAQAVQNAPTGELDSAWSSFESAIKDIPNASSVSDAVSSVTQAGQQLASAAQSTASQVNCSSSMTTTTS
jgi:LPS O-antigen subunit length determinant protein (WzzB/FepE family)